MVVTDTTPKKNGEGSQSQWDRVKNAFGQPGRVMGDDREIIALGSAPTTQIPVQAGRVAQA